MGLWGIGIILWLNEAVSVEFVFHEGPIVQGWVVREVLRRENIKSIYEDIWISKINLTWVVADNEASPVIWRTLALSPSAELLDSTTYNRLCKV